MSTITILVGTSVFLLIAWFLLKEFFVSSPLDNVPGPPSPSLIKGHMERLFHKNEGWKMHDELGNKYSPVARIKGFLGKRVLYVFDHVALQSIILKDQQYYEESSFTISMNLLLFGPGVGSTLHDQHRKQRKMLIPAFSPKHLRDMTPLFYQVAEKLRDGIKKQIAEAPGEVDILNWMGRAALELVGQAGLGYSFDPLVEDSKNSFGDAIKATFPNVVALGGMIVLGPYVSKLGPPALRRWLVNLLPSSKIQTLKSIVDLLDQRSREIIAEKRIAIQQGGEALLQQVGEGHDAMSVLHTTSGALAQMLQLLSEHPEVQEKLREEIIQASCGQNIPYDQLETLPYLDAVCRETLRMYPPATDVYREKDMILPLSEPIRGVDGTWIKEIPVPKDTRVIVSLRGCNRNKAIWGEDAEEWKPERWLAPLPHTLTDARVPGIYTHLMTFLGGGRSCIGFKFSQLEMKAVLCVLLRDFKFTSTNKPIVWNISFVKYPTVGKGSSKPSLPLMVETLKNSS
ncbi:hypothetical protein NLI96_g9816 [Meripilus lineatus]|uniref:Cytochrome P450 n=1 Tax=Meripilus lineatus TaxID=2056292 RepID=A0AAD5UUS5_9APHY|nr:hypothetical protein NLI96_g9816 [Physisporinus lineatus]